jgi:hypothetical protein
MRPNGKISSKFADLELLKHVELNKKSLMPKVLVADIPTKSEVAVLGIKEEFKKLEKELQV